VYGDPIVRSVVAVNASDGPATATLRQAPGGGPPATQYVLDVAFDQQLLIAVLQTSPIDAAGLCSVDAAAPWLVHGAIDTTTCLVVGPAGVVLPPGSTDHC